MDRRVSILKSSAHADGVNTATVELKASRKVRFSSHFVKEFTSLSEEGTIWDNTYEEAINKTDDTAHSSNESKKCCDENENSGVHHITYCFEDSDMELTGAISAMNIAAKPAEPIDLVENSNRMDNSDMELTECMDTRNLLCYTMPNRSCRKSLFEISNTVDATRREERKDNVEWTEKLSIDSNAKTVYFANEEMELTGKDRIFTGFESICSENRNVNLLEKGIDSSDKVKVTNPVLTCSGRKSVCFENDDMDITGKDMQKIALLVKPIVTSDLKGKITTGRKSIFFANEDMDLTANVNVPVASDVGIIGRFKNDDMDIKGKDKGKTTAESTFFANEEMELTENVNVQDIISSNVTCVTPIRSGFFEAQCNGTEIDEESNKVQGLEYFVNTSSQDTDCILWKQTEKWFRECEYPGLDDIMESSNNKNVLGVSASGSKVEELKNRRASGLVHTQEDLKSTGKENNNLSGKEISSNNSFDVNDELVIENKSAGVEIRLRAPWVVYNSSPYCKINVDTCTCSSTKKDECENSKTMFSDRKEMISAANSVNLLKPRKYCHRSDSPNKVELLNVSRTLHAKNESIQTSSLPLPAESTYSYLDKTEELINYDLDVLQRRFDDDDISDESSEETSHLSDPISMENFVEYIRKTSNVDASSFLTSSRKNVEKLVEAKKRAYVRFQKAMKNLQGYAVQLQERPVLNKTLMASEKREETEVLRLKSVGERIEEVSKSCKKSYEVKYQDPQSYVITSLHGSIKVKVKLDDLTGEVKNMEIKSLLNKKTSSQFAIYLNERFMKKLDEHTVKLVLGENFNIFTLLEYIRTNFETFAEMDRDFKQASWNHFVSIDENNVICIPFSSTILLILGFVYVDFNDPSNISADNVRVEMRFGELNEEAINKFALAASNSVHFVNEFCTKIVNYVKEREILSTTF